RLGSPPVYYSPGGPAQGGPWGKGRPGSRRPPTFCRVRRSGGAPTSSPREYRRSMTGLNAPDSISSLTSLTVAWLRLEAGSTILLPPRSAVTSASGRVFHRGAAAGARDSPPGFSSRRHRLNVLLPTASNTTSYRWSSFVKSWAV